MIKFVVIICAAVLCLFQTVKAPIQQLQEPTAEVIAPAEITPSPQPSPTPEIRRGTAQPIPKEIRKIMHGISMPDGASITYDELSYLTIPHYDFEYKITQGHMVVANEIAEDVLNIFAELYDIKYPIEHMELIDYFNDKQTETLDSLDRASMGNNNTSAFCYRVVSGSTNLSKHALGRAIDINPLINPYVTQETVSPRNAYKYADRTGSGLSDVEKRAMIHAGDEAYNIFRKYGFDWGGEIWQGIYDYQHFQKTAD